MSLLWEFNCKSSSFSHAPPHIAAQAPVAVYLKGLCIHDGVLFPTGQSMTHVIIHMHLCAQRHIYAQYTHRSILWSIIPRIVCITSVWHQNQPSHLLRQWPRRNGGVEIEKEKHFILNAAEWATLRGHGGSAPDVFCAKWLLDILLSVPIKCVLLTRQITDKTYCRDSSGCCLLRVNTVDYSLSAPPRPNLTLAWKSEERRERFFKRLIFSDINFLKQRFF